MQKVKLDKLGKRLVALNLEIKEQENDIENRKKEIKEIEKRYGEKQDTVVSNL